jgi:hypothetical protein
MEALFENIAELRFRHQYYHDLKTKDFTVIPFPDTQKILKNNRMIFKPLADGFRLLMEFRKVSDNTEPLLPLISPFKLCFFIKLDNPLFFNFSKLPFIDPVSEAFYFTNYKKPLEETPSSLAASDFVSEKDIVRVISNNIEYHVREEDREIEVVDLEGKRIYDGKVTYNNNVSDISIDIPDRSCGYYELSNKQEYKQPYYFTEKQPRFLFGITELFFDMTACGHINAQKGTIQYYLDFESRPTRWNYRIRLKNNTSNHLEIIDEAQKITFALDESHSSSEERQIISEQLILSREAYDHSFALFSKNTITGAKRILIERLPSPSPRSIVKSEDKSYDFLSTIFLQL